MRSPERRLEMLERRIPPPSGPPPPLAAVPNIIDFVMGDAYLGRHLYPRQATLLKVLFLAVELLTGFDRRVLAEWESETERDESVLVGGFGLPMGILERIALCQSAGRRWFAEWAWAIGRRGSKGYLASFALAYVLYHHLITDVHSRYGFAADKRLVLSVFAATKDQSQGVLWEDLRNVIVHGPCFAPYVAEVRSDRVLLRSHTQLARSRSPHELPAFAVVAREATESAGRGYEAFALGFDEAAHADASGSSVSIDDVWGAARPSLTLFGMDAFTVLLSSPRHQLRRFYQSFQTGLRSTPTGEPLYPEMLSLQLPSWELYRDWDQADRIPRYPGGDPFPPNRRALVSEDDPELQRQRETDPDRFDTEYGAQWRSVSSPYFRSEMVFRAQEPFDGRVLVMRDRGEPGLRYVCHVDLGLVGDNAALVVAHAEPGDDPGRPHIVVDLIRLWRPSDFADGHIRLHDVEAELKQLISRFELHRLTFDQFNSASLVEHLGKFGSGREPRTEVEMVSATQTRNRAVAETFKSALYEGRVHIPEHSLARDELLALTEYGHRVDHPSSGPTTSKDIVDALFEVTSMLTVLEHDPGDLFRGLRLGARRWPHTANDPVFEALSDVGRRRGQGYTRPLPPRFRREI